MPHRNKREYPSVNKSHRQKEFQQSFREDVGLRFDTEGMKLWSETRHPEKSPPLEWDRATTLKVLRSLEWQRTGMPRELELRGKWLFRCSRWIWKVSLEPSLKGYFFFHIVLLCGLSWENGIWRRAGSLIPLKCSVVNQWICWAHVEEHGRLTASQLKHWKAHPSMVTTHKSIAWSSHCNIQATPPEALLPSKYCFQSLQRGRGLLCFWAYWASLVPWAYQAL